MSQVKEIYINGFLIARRKILEPFLTGSLIPEIPVVRSARLMNIKADKGLCHCAKSARSIISRVVTSGGVESGIPPYYNLKF